MPDLKNKAFLSPQMNEVIKDIRKENNDLFSLFEKINELSNDIIIDITVDRDDKQQLLVSCLFIRAMSTYQGVAIMAERGMPSEATVILRTLVEIMFRACAIAKDISAADAYIQEDEIYRRRSINKLKKLSTKALDDIGNPDFGDLLQTLEKSIAENDIKERTTLWYAQMADLEDLYNSAYRVLSNTVHVSSRDLESALILDSTGNIIRFNYGPQQKGLPLILLAVMEFMIYILKNGVLPIFKTQFSDKVDSVRREFDLLYHGT